MNTVMHPIGTWCKRGAWLVAAIGLIGVIVEVYLFVRSSGGAPLSAVLVQLIPPVVSIVSNFVFYALILYAVGVIIDRFFAYTERRSAMAETEEDDNVTRGTVASTAAPSATVEDTAIEPETASADEGSDVTEDATSESTTPSANKVSRR
jgi:hypothetical protein